MRQQRADNAEQLRPNEMEESPELFGQMLAKKRKIFFFPFLKMRHSSETRAAGGGGGAAAVMG